MATQTGQFPFTGRIGNVIGYERNGKHYLRSMPTRVYQSPATQNAARRFGVASNRSKLIRDVMAPQLFLKGDRGRVNRLNKMLTESGIPGIKGYRFNDHTGVEKFFFQPPVFSADNKLQFPAQELDAIFRSATLEIKMIAARIDFKKKCVTGSVSSTASIDLHQPFHGLELDANVKGSGTLVVTLQIMVKIDNAFVTYDRRYWAADIVAVVPPVENAPKQTRKQRTAGKQRKAKLQQHFPDQADLPPSAGKHAQDLARQWNSGKPFVLPTVIPFSGNDDLSTQITGPGKRE